MVRRVTPSQLNSMVRKAQQKQRQAIEKFNREVRGYNQKAKRVVDNYNREVRTHNARVRADRQRLKNELIRLNRQPVTARLMTFRTSVSAVQTAHKRLEHAADVSRFDARYNEILDLSERETANSAGCLGTRSHRLEHRGVLDASASQLRPGARTPQAGGRVNYVNALVELVRIT